MSLNHFNNISHRSLKTLSTQQSKILELLLLLQYQNILKEKSQISKPKKSVKIYKKEISTLDCLKDMKYPMHKKSLKSFSGLSKYVRKMYIQEFNKTPQTDGQNRSLYPIQYKNQIKKWIKEYFELNPNFWNTQAKTIDKMSRASPCIFTS